MKPKFDEIQFINISLKDYAFGINSRKSTTKDFSQIFFLKFL